MATNTGMKPATGLRRKFLPINLVSDDLANACIPDEYFRNLLRKGGKAVQSAADLPEGKVIPEKLWNTFAVHAGRVNDMSTNHRSLGVVHRSDVFSALAVETVLCGLGSVLMLSPTFIGQSIRRAGDNGKPSDVFHALETTDFLFVTGLLDPRVGIWGEREPASLEDFLNTLRLIKYGARRMVIYDMSTVVDWSDTAIQNQLKDIYGDAGRTLIMSDLLMA